LGDNKIIEGAESEIPQTYLEGGGKKKGTNPVMGRGVKKKTNRGVGDEINETEKKGIRRTSLSDIPQGENLTAKIFPNRRKGSNLHQNEGSQSDCKKRRGGSKRSPG